MIAILEDIRSLYNVGSIFRTADAFGVEKLYLTGATGYPHPDEPWREDHQKLHKTALGAEQTVVWEYNKKVEEVVQELRSDGYQIICLELTRTSQTVTSFVPNDQPLALIVGNEVGGIRPETLTLADAVVHLPMLGAKESLNVSVAFGVAAFWLTQKN